MNPNRPKKTTKAELEYVRHMRGTSALEMLDTGASRVVDPSDYPPPLKRLVAQERSMLHLKLTPALKRKLEARSRASGLSADKLAKKWIEQGIRRAG
jgi:hypothetical protein